MRYADSRGLIPGMRIRHNFMTVLFLALLIVVQVKSFSEVQSEPAQHQRHEDDEEGLPASSADVPADSSVITIEGVCDKTDTVQGSKSDIGPQGDASSRVKGAECKTIVTKAQYEKLVNALNPKMPGMLKRQLATSYPRLLLFAQEARELHLDQDPVFAERMRFASIQLLAQSLNGYFEQEANKISDSDVQLYYQQNAIKFEKAELLRILVPKQSPESSTSNAGDQSHNATLEYAQKLQTRAAAGEDFQVLQKEAFEAAHISSGTPNVSTGKVVANRLPLTHQIVFEMKPGQVSQVIADTSGYYIYKMVRTEMTPLSQASKEIRKTIAAQRVQDSAAALTNSLKFELYPSYFGAAAAERAPSGSPAPAHTASDPTSQ